MRNRDPRSDEEARKDSQENLAEKMRNIEEKTREYEYIKIIDEYKSVIRSEDGIPQKEQVPVMEYVNVFEIQDLKEFTKRVEHSESHTWMTEEEFNQTVAEEL